MNDHFFDKTNHEFPHDEVWYMDEFERVKFVERTAALMVAVGIGELDGDGKRIFPPAGFLWKFLRAHSHDSDEEFDAALERLRQAR